MLNVAICDDDSLYLEHSEKVIRAYMAKHPAEIDLFSSGESLMQSMSAGDYVPDIAILDIELGGMDGISLSKELNRVAPRCRIIFLTNYINFAPDVYFTDHTWFVLKLDIEKYMGPALEKAIISLSADSASIPCIVVKIGGKISLLPVSEVLYTELVGRKTRIVTERGEVISSKSPRELLSAIPDDRIARCHQSFYVNVDKIADIGKNDLRLTSGDVIPISRTYRSSLKSAFFSKLLWK